VTKKQPRIWGLRDYTKHLYLKSQFDFSLYFQNALPDHIKITDVKFLQWFIGFSDGSFIISKTYCSFIINQKEIACYITYGLVLIW
jgi:hypothetical protein